jgi:Membrane bound O-acyl transferase family
MVPQALHQNEYLVYVYPDHPSQIAPQICSVRHLPLPHAMYPTLRQRPRRRHHLRLNLSMVPRFSRGASCTLCGAMMVYTMVDMFYLISALIGRILLRQPAWRWPPLFERPWASTSLADFWRFRWHQMFRYVFVVLGSRPVGAKLGRPGALLGAFAVSSLLFVHISRVLFSFHPWFSYL